MEWTRETFRICSSCYMSRTSPPHGFSFGSARVYVHYLKMRKFLSARNGRESHFGFVLGVGLACMSRTLASSRRSRSRVHFLAEGDQEARKREFHLRLTPQQQDPKRSTTPLILHNVRLRCEAENFCRFSTARSSGAAENFCRMRESFSAQERSEGEISEERIWK